MPNDILDTVEILTQYIFFCILHMVSDAQKYDVSENFNNYKLNGIRSKMHMSTQTCHKGLDAHRFSSLDALEIFNKKVTYLGKIDESFSLSTYILANGSVVIIIY